MVDGHDIAALQAAFATAKETKGKPTAIIAKTLKGKGIEGVEDLDNWHGECVPSFTLIVRQTGWR